MRRKTGYSKSSLNSKGFYGQSVKVGKYSLEVTRTGTVYWNSGKGKRKLDSLSLERTGILSVSLPDGKEVELYNTPEGIKVK